MLRGLFTALLLLLFSTAWANTEGGSAEFVETPYEAQNVVFDFYFDDPDKINSALYWLKGLVEPLMAYPYNYAPEDLNIKVIIHGTELVTLAKHNYERYRNAVDRMRYYALLGVEFKVCYFAAQDYGYKLQDLQDFVQVVPSGIAELAHWQKEGYVMIAPHIQDKRYSIEEIR
jgi:intracellular sulfur oxidation DsrE/DsrF family protein